MARLLKIDLAGTVNVCNFTSQRNTKIGSFNGHLPTSFKKSAEQGFIPNCVTLQFHKARLSYSYSFTFFNELQHMGNQKQSDLLKEIELLRQINAIQQQTIDSLTKSQQNILNNLLRKDNRVTSFPVKIILN